MKTVETIFANPTTRFYTLFLAAALPLAILAFRNTYRLVNLGSDENYFSTTPSNFYLSEDLPEANLVRMAGTTETTTQFPRRGDIVLSIDGRRLRSYTDVDAVTASRPDMIRMELMRPDQQRLFLSFDVPGDLLHDELIWEIPPSVYVFSILPGGVAERAGMRRGDLIHEIDGKTFGDAREADQLVRTTLHGQTVRYGILRDGEFTTLELTMARLTIPLSLVIFLLAGYLWFLAAVLLACTRARLRAARMLAIGWLTTATGFLLYESRGLISTALFPDSTRVIGWLALYIGPAILIHASFYFPRELPALEDSRAWRWAVYPMAVLALIGTAFLGEEAIGPALVLLFIPLTIYRVRHLPQIGTEQLRTERFLFVGVILTLFAASVWSFAHGGLSPDSERLLRSLAAFAILSAYGLTITRYRLLGIAVRRGPLYSLLTVLWFLLVWGGCAVFFALVARAPLNFFNVSLTGSTIQLLGEVTAEVRDRNENMSLMVLALVAGALALGLTRWGRHRLRRLFHRPDYDFLEASSELTELFASRIGLTDLATGVADNLVRRMMLDRVAVLVFDEEGQARASVCQGRDGREHEVCSPHRAPILAGMLKGYRSTLRVDYLGPELQPTFLREGFRYVQPVRSKDKLLGCLIVGDKLAETSFRPNDFQFLTAAARQASVAFENALLYDQLAYRERLAHELDLARHIQISSLPQTEPNVRCLDISGASIPALEVGGDYYAYFTEADRELTVITADVSGKGTSAALYMSKMQGIFASLQKPGRSPRDLFLEANPILYRETERTVFVTAICVRFDTEQRKLSLARAGHPPLFCYRTNHREAYLLQPRGLGLGLENRGLLAELMAEETLAFEVNDVFLLLTDGIVETFNPEGEVFGETRLLTLLRNNAHRSATAIRKEIFDQLADFSFGTEQHDDQTLVVVKVVEDDCDPVVNELE